MTAQASRRRDFTTAAGRTASALLPHAGMCNNWREVRVLLLLAILAALVVAAPGGSAPIPRSPEPAGISLGNEDGGGGGYPTCNASTNGLTWVIYLWGSAALYVCHYADHWYCDPGCGWHWHFLRWL